MDKRIPALAEQLLLIERELRVLGWWAEHPPAPEALSSPEPFCVDTLDFEAWLQWILLPRMKQILEAELPLPGASGILAMGEESFKRRQADVAALLTALAEFDRLISEAH